MSKRRNIFVLKTLKEIRRNEEEQYSLRELLPNEQKYKMLLLPFYFQCDRVITSITTIV